MKHRMKKFYSQIVVETKTNIVRKSSKKKNLELIKAVKIQQRDIKSNSDATYMNQLITLHHNVPIMVMLMTPTMPLYQSPI